MYGFIYLTTNSVNGKRYLGLCSFEKDTNGRYLGSGKLIKQAIRKYGRENFTRTILEECDTYDELSAAERKWITYYDADHSPDFYNLSKGGKGGNSDDLKAYWAQFTPEERRTMRNWKMGPKSYAPWMKGRTHTEETKRLIGSKSVNRNWGRKTPITGENNPMFGRSAITEQRLRWFTNGVDTKYLPEGGPIPEGYRRGRTIRK